MDANKMDPSRFNSRASRVRPRRSRTLVLRVELTTPLPLSSVKLLLRGYLEWQEWLFSDVRVSKLKEESR